MVNTNPNSQESTTTMKPSADRKKQVQATQFVSFEEMQQVEQSYRMQRKLSFSFGFLFFALTLLIPFLGGTAVWWYGTPIFLGLTLNFWTSILLFHVLYWLIAFFFVRKANRLDEHLNNQIFK
jgi:uncharacterized membrane protein (DUF485 family)